MSIRINNKIISGTYTAQSYRYVGEIFQSALPIQDSRVALLDGRKIYESEGYGSFIQYITSLALLYPQLSCTEDEWQLSDTTYGECGKFVISKDGVRLPKIVSFIQGLSSLQDLATLVEAGLPNIKGNMKMFGDQGVGSTTETLPQGALYSGELIGTGIPMRATNHDGYRLAFDASRSNPIYGNSNTVQPQSIRYPYYIVLATGVTQEVKVKEELTTNIPFTLFESKYSEVELNNTSWLLSSGQWNSKELYPSAYNELIKNVNNGEAHFVSNKMYYFTNIGEPALTYVITTEKAKVGQAVYGLSTGFKNYIEEVTENGFKFTDPNYGYLEFVYSPNLNNSNTYNPTDYEFIINTSEETFRLPLLDGSESIVDYSTRLGLGYTTTNTNFPFSGVAYFGYKGASNTSAKVYVNDIEFGLNGSSASNINGQTAYIVSKNDVYRYEVESNGQYGALYPFKGNGSLYFYVGDTNINISLVDTGKLTQEVANLIPNNSSLISGYSMPSDRYVDLTLGASGSTYTAPANGWLYIWKEATAVGQYVVFTNQTSPMANIIYAPTNSTQCRMILPLKKGNIVKIDYTLAGNTRSFRFIYAEGEI